MPNTQKIVKSIAVKDAAIDNSTGKLCGKPSVTGVLDLYNDVIFPGAFKTCLKDFLRRGFISHDHIWQFDALVGFPTVAEERGNALYSEFVFHSDAASQAAKVKCEERLAAGLEVGLSIGFSMEPGQWIYFANGKELLAYAKANHYDMSLFDVAGITCCLDQCTAIVGISDLWEYSLTPSPANQAAMAIAVKSHKSAGLSLSTKDLNHSRMTGNNTMPTKLKSICGKAGLPLADDDMAWSAKAAIKSVKEFAKAEDEPNADYAKMFVIVDGPNDEFGSYKLPFADVVDGELKAVPRGIMAVAGALDGARGGVELSDKDEAAAKTFISKYYEAMKKDAPWDKDKANGSEIRWKGQYLGDYVEYSMCMSALNSAHYALQNEVADALTGYDEYKAMDNDEMMDAIGNMYDEHKSLSLSVIKAIKGGQAEETPEQAALSVRHMAAALLSSLGDGLTYTQHARVTVDAARALIDRTKSRIDMRLKDGRALSEANRQTLKDHRDALAECLCTIDDLLKQTEPKADMDKARSLRIQFLRLQLAA